MPRWLISLLISVGSIAGAATAIRVALIKPARDLIAKLDALLDLPDAVRDLTTTLIRYVAETEPRLTRVEQSVALIARTLRIRLRLKEDEENTP